MFINPIHHWQIMLIILTTQTLAVLVFGWVIKIIIRRKYNTPTSDYQLFDCSVYNLRPDFDTSTLPNNSLVLVRFNSDRTIKREDFYTNIGDWIYVEYENGKQISISKASYPFSQLVMASFCLPGFIIITALKVFFYLFDFSESVALDMMAKKSSRSQIKVLSQKENLEKVGKGKVRHSLNWKLGVNII